MFIFDTNGNPFDRDEWKCFFYDVMLDPEKRHHPSFPDFVPIPIKIVSIEAIPEDYEIIGIHNGYKEAEDGPAQRENPPAAQP